MLNEFIRDDPPTTKKLPVEVDVPEWLMEKGLQPEATTLETAVGCLTLIAFFYLLRVGEYTVKSSHKNTKRTVQFKMEDVVFFKRNATGQLRQLSRHAPDSDILTAVSRMTTRECASIMKPMGIQIFAQTGRLQAGMFIFGRG
jgi:hypothetical protein